MVTKCLFDRKVKWLQCKKIIKNFLFVIRNLLSIMCQPKKTFKLKNSIANNTKMFECMRTSSKIN